MIKLHHQFIGLTPNTALPLAQRLGLNVESAEEATYTPEKLYVRTEGGIITEAFEIVDNSVSR